MNKACQAILSLLFSIHRMRDGYLVVHFRISARSLHEDGLILYRKYLLCFLNLFQLHMPYCDVSQGLLEQGSLDELREFAESLEKFRVELVADSDRRRRVLEILQDMQTKQVQSCACDTLFTVDCPVPADLQAEVKSHITHVADLYHTHLMRDSFPHPIVLILTAYWRWIQTCILASNFS